MNRSLMATGGSANYRSLRFGSAADLLSSGPGGCAAIRPSVISDVPPRARAFHPHARAKKLPRAAECLVYSLTPSGVLAENHPKNRGFVGILRGQKCLKR